MGESTCKIYLLFLIIQLVWGLTPQEKRISLAEDAVPIIGNITLPYREWTPCSYFTTDNTNSAGKNTVECTFELCPSDQINFRMCFDYNNPTSGECLGDTYLRLFDNGTEVYSNDDYCGFCSGGNYITVGTECRTYSLHQGCYSYGSCEGQVMLYRAPVIINPIPTAEMSTLSSLYSATSSKGWHWHGIGQKWNFTDVSKMASICSPDNLWEGISCDCSISNTNCHIIVLKLPGYLLRGSIAKVPFHQLTYLDTLDLSDNFISGIHPVFRISTLLYTLLMMICKIGEIPDSVGYIPILRELIMSGNYLSSSIPSTLTHLSLTLHKLQLSDNILTGSIPDFISDFVHLEQLEIGVNHLDGTLPSALCELPDLLSFNVGENRLESSLPDCIYDVWSSLKDLDLHMNHFTGTLSHSFGSLGHLNILMLSHNFFTGIIPDSFYSTEFNAWIYLDHNYFHGKLSWHIWKLSDVQDFDVSYNMLTGPLPDYTWYLSELYYFNVEHNHLSGSITDQLYPGYQIYLRTVVLGANKFTGTLPANLFATGYVQSFSAYSNCFDNIIPTEICRSYVLKTLVLDGMQTSPYCRKNLVGSKTFLPIYKKQNSDVLQCLLYRLPLLQVLHLSGLGLQGNALEEVKWLGPYLYDVALPYNHLTGTIPEVMQERKWKKLDLAFNFLTGDLVENFNSVIAEPKDNDYGPFYDDYASNNLTSSYPSNISLNINHLSGRIPPTLLGNNFDNPNSKVNVIDGNLFSCSYDKAQIPYHDPAWERYDCGSNSFNASYYFYLGTLTFILLLSFAISAYYELKVLPIAASVYTFVNNVLSKHELPIHQDLEEFDLQRVYKFYKVLNYVEKIVLVVLFYLIILMTPIYTVIAKYYNSYTHAYAWTVSAAYKEGVGAAVIELVFFVLLIIIMAVVWRNPHGNHMKLTDALSNSRRKSVVTTHPNPMHNAQSTAFMSSQPSMSSQLVRQLTRATSFVFSTPFMKWVIVFGAEFGLVGVINLLFVYITITGTRSQVFAAQVGLTVFGFIWCSRNIEAFTTFVEARLTRANFSEGGVSRFSVGYYLNMCKKKMEIARHHYWLQLFMTSMNNIWISLVIVAFVSTSCFYYALVNPGTVSSNYHYETCGQRDIFGNVLYCTKYAYELLSSVYTPPFTYSYQCSSVIIVYFAPSLMYSCAIDSFIIPAAQLLSSYMLKRWNRKRTEHYAEDHHYNGPPSQDPLLNTHHRSLWRKFIKIVKEASVSSFLVPVKIVKIKREIPDENTDDNHLKLCIEEMDESLEDHDVDESDGYYVYLRMVGHYTGEVYLSSTQEALKILAYMFLVLTFGYAFPPLGVAICATMLIYIRFLQWKMRTFMTKVWEYARLDLLTHFSAKHNNEGANADNINHLSDVPLATVVMNHTNDASIDDQFNDLDSVGSLDSSAKSLENRHMFSRVRSTSPSFKMNESLVGSALGDIPEVENENKNGIEMVPARRESSIGPLKINFGSKYGASAMAGAPLDGNISQSSKLPKKFSLHQMKKGNSVNVSSSKMSMITAAHLSKHISRVISFHVDCTLIESAKDKLQNVTSDEANKDSNNIAPIKGLDKDSDKDVRQSLKDEEKARISKRQLALHSCLQALDYQCIDFADMLYRAKWPVLWTACVFYSFFLFDTVGSKLGLMGSYWTLLLLLVIPVIIYLTVEKGDSIQEYVAMKYRRMMRKGKYEKSMRKVAVDTGSALDNTQRADGGEV